MYWGSRRTYIRAALALAGVAVLGVSVGLCTGNPDAEEAEALVRDFTELLDHRDAAGAAALTSYPNAATTSIKQLFDGLQPGIPDYEVSQFVDLGSGDAFFTVDVAWHFGAGKDWSYRVQGKASKLAVGWRISWEPDVLMPGLGHSRTARLVKTYAAPPVVRDIAGGALMTEQTVNVVRLDPARTPNRVASAAAVAAAIEPVAPLITTGSLLHDLDAAAGKPIIAVTLRDDDFAILGPRLAPIPGVLLSRDPKLISADRRISSPLLDALRMVWQQSRDATAGWAVQTFDPDGSAAEKIAGYQGPAGPDINSTLDTRLQLAAEDAVASVGSAASVVAIQPSTGAVVAAAQNSYATDLGPVAFTGLYPAGDSLELFESGIADLKKQRPQDVSTSALLNTVSRLGIGADVQVPGLPVVTGRISGSKLFEPAHFEAGGADPVQISPFGMALAASTIVRGTVPQPMITFWRPATLRSPVLPLQPEVLDRLRGLLRESTAPFPALHAFPDVTGYTANAGDGQWFIGARGDLAFAAHLTTADSGDAAPRMIANLFRSLNAPPT